MKHDQLEVRQFIEGKIRESCDQKGISVGSIETTFDLFESGAFDSLGFISLVNSIEQWSEKEIDFSELDPESLTTLGSLIRVVVMDPLDAEPPRE